MSFYSNTWILGASKPIAVNDGGGGQPPSYLPRISNVTWYQGPNAGRGGLKPLITPLVSSATLSVNTLTISGQRFQAKAQPEPILAYRKGVGYLNGVATDDLNTYAHGDPYTANPALWDQDFQVQVNDNLERYTGGGPTFMSIARGFLGEFIPLNARPSVNGDALRFRWNYHVQQDLFASYYSMGIEEPVGAFDTNEFNVGESLTFSTETAAAKIVAIRGEVGSRILYIGNTTPITGLEGQTVTGVTSGATALVKTGAGYNWAIKGADKFIRYDAYNAGGNRDGADGSDNLSLRLISINANDDGTLVWDDGAPASEAPAPYHDFDFLKANLEGQWHTTEYVVDTRDDGNGFGSVKRIYDGVIPNNDNPARDNTKIPVAMMKGRLPNVNLHGIDSSSEGHGGAFLYGEQYIDNTLSCVLVSSQPTWAGLAEKDNEIQYCTAWTDGSITVDYDPKTVVGQAYVYVINSDGEVNEIGEAIA